MRLLVRNPRSQGTLTDRPLLYCVLQAARPWLAKIMTLPPFEGEKKGCQTRKYSCQRRVTSSVISGLISMSGGHSRVNPSSAVFRVASTPILPP